MKPSFINDLKFLGFLLLLLWPRVQTAYAQNVDLSIMPEYASFKMNDMKALQDEQAARIYDSLGTYPQKNYNFPNYWGVGVNSRYNKTRHSLDLAIAYNATGGRLSYSDYSGLIKIDKQVSAIGISTGYSYTMISAKRIQASIGLGIGLSFSTFKENNTIIIYISDEETIESNKYASRQFFVTPKIDFVFLPLNNVFVKIFASYLNQVGSTNQVTGSYKTEYVNQSRDPVTLDWTGFRIGAGVGYRFNLSK